jgi:hypothetical protein
VLAAANVRQISEAELVEATDRNRSSAEEMAQYNAKLELVQAIAMRDPVARMRMKAAGLPPSFIDDRIPPLHTEFDRAGRCAACRGVMY